MNIVFLFIQHNWIDSRAGISDSALQTALSETSHTLNQEDFQLRHEINTEFNLQLEKPR